MRNPLDVFTHTWSPRFKWLAGVSAVYSVIALLALITGHSAWFDYIELIWIFVLSLPLWIKPLSRWLKMDKPIPKDQW